MNKEKLLEDLQLRIKSCKEDLDKLDDKIRNTPRDFWGNYTEMSAHVVGCLDAYNVIKDLIEEGRYD